MLIGLCGGICAGKNSVTNYLVKYQGFSRLHLKSSSAISSLDKACCLDRHTCVHQSNEEPAGSEEVFVSVDLLLIFVTKQWQKRWVTTDIWDEDILEKLSRRPFFILISVDAPVILRWKRFKERHYSNGQVEPTLEEFVTQDDNHLYDKRSGLAWLIDRAEISIVNQTSPLENLHKSLADLDLTNNQRLRPSWDQYFMQLASLAAQRSNCMKRRVGCVLIREKRVISTGYNGTPRNLKNCNEGGCARCNTGHGAGVELSTCLCIHAEENALLEAGRERIREGSVLYCDTYPCLTCSIKIVQVGITEVVYSQAYWMDQKAAGVLLEGGVKLRQFSPPRKGLVRSV